MAPGLIPRGAVTVIATIVIVVWAMSQAADVFVPTYEAPPEIHLAVMLVLGALFGLRKDEPAAKNDPAKAAPPPPPPPAPVEPAEPLVELPPGRVSAADLIARLQQERRDRS